MWKAERADPAGAAEALKKGFAVAHTLAQEPMVIAVLEFVQPVVDLVDLFGCASFKFW